MRAPAAFLLEDFHAQYEHRSDLRNLATSDVKYWHLSELLEKCGLERAECDSLELSYPDIEGLRVALQVFAGRVTNGVAIPTSGAAEAVFLALAAIGFRLDRQLSVALPRPAFGAFEGIATMLGHRVVPYHYRPDTGWSLDEAQLIDCAESCDVVILNTPHNPTGAVLDGGLLSTVAATLRYRGRYLICDEVLQLPDDVGASDPLGPNTIAVSSLSKMFGMPGIRLGWAIVPSDFAAQIKTLQQYTTLSLNSFAARFGAAVLPRLGDFGRRAHLEQNRRLLTDWAVNNQTVLHLGPCQAGTTTVIEMRNGVSEHNLFQQLLARGVLLAPGSCFAVTASHPWFRLGYGCETDVLSAALGIIQDVLRGRAR